MKGPDTNSRIEMVLPSAKNGFTRRSVSTPCTFELSTDPSGLAVMLPYLTPLLVSFRLWTFQLLGQSDREVASRSQVSGDLVGEHLLQSETE